MTEQPQGSVSVLAVDDHPRFLEVARAVVEATPGFSWAGGAANGEEALAAVSLRPPDLALVDVNMPGMDGVELAYQLRRAHPGVLVALLSAKPPDELPQAAGVSDTGSVLAKENLRSAWLLDVWRAHGRSRG